MSATAREIRKHYDICVLDPLTASDRALAHTILANARIVAVMRRAWRDTIASGVEHDFFIYRGKNGFYAGPVAIGTATAGPSLKWMETLGMRDQAVGNYHTHPSYNPKDGYTDQNDLNYNAKTHTLGFTQTHFGLLIGRTGHDIQ